MTKIDAYYLQLITKKLNEIIYTLQTLTRMLEEQNKGKKK